MGYRKIVNLYKDQSILEFDECYCLEKIHGSSAHISFDRNGSPQLTFYAGGSKHETFLSIFDYGVLLRQIKTSIAQDRAVIFGEVYGGKMQGMSKTYGAELKFVAFEVKMGERWLTVPDAERVVKACGLEFVDYVRIPTTLEAIDAERDKPSVQAVRNGMNKDCLREGVVLRPLAEELDSRGHRVMCKHKRDEFMETKTPRKVSSEELAVLNNAEEVAEEWVVVMRLEHILDKIENPSIEKMGEIIGRMIQDVKLESKGEVVWSKPVATAIGRKTANLYKQVLKDGLYNKEETKVVEKESVFNKIKGIFTKDGNNGESSNGEI